MAIEHVNRKGHTYFLREGKTKLGKSKYFFSKKKSGPVSDTIPEGFEVYENPAGQVFLRKIQPRLVTEDEVELVRRGVRDLAGQRHFLIDVEEKNIVVYLPDSHGIEDMADEYARFSIKSRSFILDTLMKSANYQPMMCFHLADEKARSFGVRRWCFRGAIDNWISLSRAAPLANLVMAYCPHLGQESFFDLML